MPEKVQGADWSDKEWSENSDSSENENEHNTNGLDVETFGDDPLNLFGLPAQDIGSQTRFKSEAPQKTGKSVGMFPSRKITPISMDNWIEGSPQRAGRGQPSMTWNNLLASCRKYLPQITFQFPEDWFSYVTSNVVGEAGQTKDEVDMYREIAMYCYAVVNICGLHGSVLSAGPSHINRVFQDRIPWSPELDLLEQDSELKQLVLKAYR